MASWDWDVTFDMSDLTKRHAQLEKLVKNPPDAAKNKAKRQNLDKQINEKKLEYAQKQFDLEQMKLRLKAARDTFRHHLNEQKSAATVKEAHYKNLSSAKSTLNAKFSGRKITNPEEQKKEVENEIRALQIELKTGDHRTNGETKIIRAIEEKRDELETIKGYIANNVGQFQKDYENTAEEFGRVQRSFKAKVKNTDDAQKNREKLKKEHDQVNEDKNLISESIKELAGQKQLLREAFQKSVKDYEKNRREHADITVAIAMNKNKRVVRERETVVNNEIQKRQKKQQAVQEEKAMKKRAEELERQRATEEKRKKAIEAYNNMQKKLKARNVTSVVSARPSGGAKKAAVASSRSDPHAADKEMCRSLIVLCESMVPSRKGKKKKKVRLVYRADSFVKFNQVGVKIPKYAKDLPETIKALNSRIVSYDEEVPTEKVSMKEEPQKEEAVESGETSENQI